MTLAALRERKTCAPRSLGFRRRFPTPYPGGSGSPDSAANSGRAGLTPPSLAQRRRERQSYQGASGGPDSAAISGRPGRHPPLEGCRPARGPGGLPGRSLSLSLGRESEARTSGPTGVIYLRENPAGQKRERRTNQRFTKLSSRTKKPSAAAVFGHFLLIKKVATPASGFCLTISQITALPMAQAKKASQRFRQLKNRNKA